MMQPQGKAAGTGLKEPSSPLSAPPRTAGPNPGAAWHGPGAGFPRHGSAGDASGKRPASEGSETGLGSGLSAREKKGTVTGEGV